MRQLTLRNINQGINVPIACASSPIILLQGLRKACAYGPLWCVLKFKYQKQDNCFKCHSFGISIFIS